MCAPRVTRHTSIRYSSSCQWSWKGWDVLVRPTIATWPRWTRRHGSLQKWRISMHPCWRVCENNLNIVSMCAVSPVVHTSNVSSCQKKLQCSCGCEQFHSGRSFGFLVINVCSHSEHYETPCIIQCTSWNFYFPRCTSLSNDATRVSAVLQAYAYQVRCFCTRDTRCRVRYRPNQIIMQRKPRIVRQTRNRRCLQYSSC
jgi:hypothetical protein